eukprot:13468828-Alexandrium_andersonii.AAC.1
MQPGMSREAWMKRTPCPGCGSRWHRDCRNRGGGGKGKGGPSSDSRAVFSNLWKDLELVDYSERKTAVVQATRE